MDIVKEAYDLAATVHLQCNDSNVTLRHVLTLIENVPKLIGNGSTGIAIVNFSVNGTSLTFSEKIPATVDQTFLKTNYVDLTNRSIGKSTNY